MKILIVIQGGVLQDVLATAPVEVTKLDWDDLNAGEELSEYSFSAIVVSEEQIQQRIEEARRESKAQWTRRKCGQDLRKHNDGGSCIKESDND